ncbi:MAG: glycogen/starch synthase [Polyangiaceae bacterium]
MVHRPLRVLMVSSEVEGFARTGGLGDVLTGLSKALAARGADVVVVTPRYGVTRTPETARPWADPLVVPVGWGAGDVRSMTVHEVKTPPKAGEGSLRVCLLDDPGLFGRDGIYGDRHGTFGDNAYRFAALSSGALAVSDRVWGAPTTFGGTGPDVLHAHDWHAALAIVYAKLTRGVGWRERPAVFTIHNLAFQGVLGFDELDVLGVPRAAFHEGVLAHDGRVNLMKGAIQLADRVTTVSPTYAREIMTPEFGYGLDFFLRTESSKIVGIVNGIDVEDFDPGRDSSIDVTYTAESPGAARAKNRAALLRTSGLDATPDAPLFAVVSRLTWQKGIDTFADVVPGLVDRGARVLFVGTGDVDLEDRVRGLAARFPGRVAARIAFDANLARQTYAAADFVVVPSRYEPCGLTQLYAMRYGAIPIVAPVGGLIDTVTDCARPGGTGIVADGGSAHALFEACVRALDLHRDPEVKDRVVAAAMAADNAWSRSADDYLVLYDGTVEPRSSRAMPIATRFRP